MARLSKLDAPTSRTQLCSSIGSITPTPKGRRPAIAAAATNSLMRARQGGAYARPGTRTQPGRAPEAPAEKNVSRLSPWAGYGRHERSSNPRGPNPMPPGTSDGRCGPGDGAPPSGRSPCPRDRDSGTRAFPGRGKRPRSRKAYAHPRKISSRMASQSSPVDRKHGVPAAGEGSVRSLRVRVSMLLQFLPRFRLRRSPSRAQPPPPLRRPAAGRHGRTGAQLISAFGTRGRMDRVAESAKLVHIAAQGAGGDLEPAGEVGPGPVPAALKQREEPKQPRGRFQHGLSFA